MVFFFCFAFFFLSCKKEATLSFVTQNYDYKSTENCVNKNCTYVHLEVPVAKGNEVIAKPINDAVFNFVNGILHFKNNKKTTSYDTLALNFIANYDEISRNYPDEAIAWEANFKATHGALSENTYQMMWEYYIFTGGAHGMLATKVLFFDTTTGKKIPAKDLFLDYQGFKTYAESEFRKQLTINGSLNDAGFMFKNNQFQLSENFYQTTNEWILYYNPYEIAPYVQGASIIKLPKEKVEPFLNPIHFKN